MNTNQQGDNDMDTTLKTADGDFKFPLPFIMVITHLQSGMTDTQAHKSEGEAISAAFAAARVASLSGDAYSVEIREQHSLHGENKPLHFCCGKSTLLESMRQEMR